MTTLIPKYDQGSTGAVNRPINLKFAETVSVKDFGATGDGTTDDTAAIQAAITACQTSGSSLHIPAGTYKTTSTLNITSQIVMFGDGSRSSIINFYSSATTNFAILISLADNSSVIGLDIGHIGFVCNAGAAVGSAISMTTTATNSAISQSTIHDLYIINVTIGIKLDGVIYMSAFARITIGGSSGGTVTQYGIYSVNSLSQTIYNSFSNIEVTNVGNSAYAYYMSVSASQLTNLTCDGCCYFTGFYTNITGLFIEGITAATPASTTALALNNIASVQNVGIINVPNSKCTTAIDYFGNNIFLNNVLIPDSGAGNQPNNPLTLHGGQTGTVNNYEMLSVAVSGIDVLGSAILNGFTITNSPNIFGGTNYNLSYAIGTWTPAYATWSTPPTTIVATYTKIGRQVTVCLYGLGGVCSAGSTITGLPFACSATSASNASAWNQTANAGAFGGAIAPSATTIGSLSASTLTANYWQMSATYFV